MAATTNRGDKSQLWAQLMERAQQGDLDAFHALFNDVGPLITRFVARRITRRVKLRTSAKKSCWPYTNHGILFSRRDRLSLGCSRSHTTYARITISVTG